MLAVLATSRVEARLTTEGLGPARVLVTLMVEVLARVIVLLIVVVEVIAPLAVTMAQLCFSRVIQIIVAVGEISLKALEICIRHRVVVVITFVIVALDPLFAPVWLMDECLSVLVHLVEVTAEVPLEPVVVLISHRARVRMVFALAALVVEAERFSVNFWSEVLLAAVCKSLIMTVVVRPE